MESFQLLSEQVPPGDGSVAVNHPLRDLESAGGVLVPYVFVRSKVEPK